MKQHLWLFISFLFLSACASEPIEIEGGIVLKTYRQGAVFPTNAVYIVDTDGSGVLSEQVSSKLGDEPAWSSDGQWITFHASQSSVPHDTAIYIIKSDGSQRKRITDERGNFHPTWSPDDTRIAFYASNGVYILDVEGLLRGEKEVPKPILLTEGISADWSPDGKQMVYRSLDGDILVINADGTGEPLNLTAAHNSVLGPSGAPKWSPDGKRIAFSSYQVDHSDVFAMNADGSDLTNLTNGNGSSSSPEWSPDGSKILFVSTRDASDQKIGLWDPTIATALYLMNADGTDVLRLSLRDDEHVLWYEWVPQTPKSEEIP
jgi:Tol biopolymer transport system component